MENCANFHSNNMNIKKRHQQQQHQETLLFGSVLASVAIFYLFNVSLHKYHLQSCSRTNERTKERKKVKYLKQPAVEFLIFFRP